MKRQLEGNVRRKELAMRNRRGTWMVLLFAMMLVTASCGNDDEGADGRAGAGATGEPFRVGYVTDLSGIARDSYAPVLEGFQLYVEQLNAEGGIDGHPIEVVVRDDESSQDRSVAAATELATRENVTAIFGLSLSSTHQAVFEAMEREEIPVVTGFSGIASTLPPEPAPFGYTAGNVDSVIGTVGGEMMPDVLDSGRLVCTTIDTVGGVQGCENTEKAARESGFDIGDRVVFPIAAQDFAPIARDIVGSDPEVVIGHFGSFWHQNMLIALRTEGYEGPYVATPWGTSEASLREGAATGGGDGGVFFYTRWAVVDEDAPGMGDLRAAAEEFGTDFELQNPHVQGWALARIAHEALAACGFPCLGPDFKNALQDVEVDFDGLTGGPMQFAADDHHGPSWWRLYRLGDDGETLEPIGDWQEQPPSGGG